MSAGLGSAGRGETTGGGEEQICQLPIRVPRVFLGGSLGIPSSSCFPGSLGLLQLPLGLSPTAQPELCPRGHPPASPCCPMLTQHQRASVADPGPAPGAAQQRGCWSLAPRIGNWLSFSHPLKGFSSTFGAKSFFEAIIFALACPSFVTFQSSQSP